MEFFKDLEIEGGSKLNECMRLILEGVAQIGWGRNSEKEEDLLPMSDQSLF